MDDLEFKRYISNIANLGDAKQTGLYVFDILDKFKLSSNNKFLIEDITDLYVNFVYLQILLATRHFSTIFVKLSSLDVFNGIFKKNLILK